MVKKKDTTRLAKGEKRGGDGRYQKGTKGGPGNPMSGKVMAYRKALYEAVSVEDVQHIARSMVEAACAGDVAAAKVILERCLGKVTQEVQVGAGAGSVLEFRIVEATPGEN